MNIRTKLFSSLFSTTPPPPPPKLLFWKSQCIRVRTTLRTIYCFVLNVLNPPPPSPAPSFFFPLISLISFPFLLFLDYEADNVNEPKALALFDDSEEDGKGN